MPDKSYSSSKFPASLTSDVCDAFSEDAVFIRDSNHRRAIAAALKR